MNWPQIRSTVITVGAVLLAVIVGYLAALVFIQTGDDAVTACRARVASDLSTAQADFLIATAELAIPEPGDDPDVELAAFIADREALRTARDARDAFELEPTGECSS